MLIANTWHRNVFSDYRPFVKVKLHSCDATVKCNSKKSIVDCNRSPWVLSAPDGPYLAPWTMISGAPIMFVPQTPLRACCHDDVIKWKHCPRYWPFVRGIHRSSVNSPHKGQWHGALMCSLICVWINGWVNNHEAGDLRRYRAHYDVTVMCWTVCEWACSNE